MQNKNSDPDLGKATDWSDFANQLLGGRDKVEKVIRSHTSWSFAISESQHRKKKKRREGGRERGRERESARENSNFNWYPRKQANCVCGWVPMKLHLREIQWPLHKIWNLMPTVSWTATKTLPLNSFKTSRQTKLPISPFPQKQYRSTRTCSQVSHRSGPTLSTSFLYVPSLCHNKCPEMGIWNTVV